MNIQLIEELIDQRDYQSCITWYLDHGQNAFLQLMIEQDASSTFANRLFTEMREEIEGIKASESLLEQTSPTDATIFKTETVASNASDDILTQLRYKAGQLFKKMKTERLKTFSPDIHKRKAAALQTLEYQQQNKAVWRDIDFYKTNGYLPGDIPDLPLSGYSVKELMSEIKKHEMYIRKFTAKQREEGVSDHVLQELKTRKAQLLQLTKEIEKR